LEQEEDEDLDEHETDDGYRPFLSQQQPPPPPPQHPHLLSLDLDLEDDPPPYYDDLVDKQSPASGLPPQSPPPPATANLPVRSPPPPLQQQQPVASPLLITPEHIRQPRGEYIPLNPDIDKAHPPRWAAAAAAGDRHRWIRDPFNVSDEEAPPVPAESLSPSHIFASIDDLHAAISQCGGDVGDVGGAGDQSEMDAADDDDDEDDAVSSVMDDDLPDPDSLVQEECQPPSSPLSTTTTAATSPSSVVMSSPYGTYSKVVKKPGKKAEKIHSPGDNKATTTSATATDLDAVAIGALDYEQLMNYFEGLKESAA
jgi:hypothetical protein